LLAAGDFFYIALMIRTPGRSLAKIAGRNEKLTARYYFYNTIVGLKLSRCLQILSEEFDLSESRVVDLIAFLSAKIKDHEYKATSVEQLRDRYPYLVWSYRA